MMNPDKVVQIVLIGPSRSGKSSSGNTILGRKHFKTEASAKSVTVSCESKAQFINGLKVTVVDTPGWDCTELPESEVKSQIRQTLQDLQGPYSFLLVLHGGAVDSKDIRKIYGLQNLLGHSYFDHTTILFSHSDMSKYKTFEKFLSEGGDTFQELLWKCSNRCYFWNNRGTRSVENVEKLLQDLKQTETTALAPTSVSVSVAPPCTKPKKRLDKWRFVLLGKTGVGKSATGNTILGERVFNSEVRATSVTVKCNAQTRVVNQRCITVMDTPGLYDTGVSIDFVIKEIMRGLEIIAPGPHAFLLVIDVKRFTTEERNTVRHFQEFFGDNVHKHMIVIFTRGDDLEYDNKTPEQFISEAGHDLQQLISACGNRYQVFNNRKTDRTQVQKLLEKISTMLSQNKDEFYSYELFMLAQEINEQREKSRDKEKRIAKLEDQVWKLQKKCSNKNCNIL